VTPAEGGALDLVEQELSNLGFRCTRIERGGIQNLYARWGHSAPIFAFAGHTDVVPPGAPDDWNHPPFSGIEESGILWGRGAVDMKSGVACFIAAVAQFLEMPPEAGSISLLITGDEEGDALDGTVAILDWMRENGETADLCIVGEPTSVVTVGDTVKIGRRGSMTGQLKVVGTQGHTAYPERACNPLPVLAKICAGLSEVPLDLGSMHFQPSTLALSTIDVGNPTSNVIPSEGSATFNVRFNDTHSSADIKIWVQQIIALHITDSGCEAEISWKVSGESFVTEPGPLTDIVVDAISDRTLERPALTTGGGTSDARFIKDLCPVIEVGLVGDTMHQVDERVPVEDVRTLSAIYLEILRRFFGQ